jgi:hypothetical protein
VFTQEVLIVNDQGNTIFNFNRKGQGPEEYGQIRAIGFFNSNQIIIIGAWSYKIYDLRGNFIKGDKFGKKILAQAQLYSPVLNFSNKNADTLVVIKGGEFDAEKVLQEGNIDNNWISLINTTNKNAISGVTFEADIYQKQALPVEKTPYYTVNQKENRLYIIFPFEQYIYAYDLENLNLLSKTPTTPSFFTKLQGLPLKQSKNYGALNKLALRNSRYGGIYSLRDNLVLTSYATKVSESLMSNEDSEELYFEREKSRKKYVQLFENLTKVVPDIKLPKGFSFVGGFSLDHLILEKDDMQDEEAIIYYRASINLIDK